MKYFSKETSEKLHKIGCVSKSRFAYCIRSREGESKFILLSDQHDLYCLEYENYPAFNPWDICCNEDYAQENAKKLWGGWIYCSSCFHEWPDDGASLCPKCKKEIIFERNIDYKRHEVVDSRDPESIVIEALNRLEEKTNA